MKYLELSEKGKDLVDFIVHQKRQLEFCGYHEHLDSLHYKGVNTGYGYYVESGIHTLKNVQNGTHEMVVGLSDEQRKAYIEIAKAIIDNNDYELDMQFNEPNWDTLKPSTNSAGLPSGTVSSVKLAGIMVSADQVSRQESKANESAKSNEPSKAVSNCCIL